MDASRKRYLPGDEVLLDRFRLARKIYDFRWDPDLLVILGRGGAPVGIAIHEFFTSATASRQSGFSCLIQLATGAARGATER
jgi:hypoxanthine phosphoribosyltransferase